ncbi:hypothetical protein JOS77_25295 [Chromobacterium haemolyticum]|nr:hypothetical protein JOS77_25295 [Chromobacterium haemolyticum]
MRIRWPRLISSALMTLDSGWLRASTLLIQARTAACSCTLAGSTTPMVRSLISPPEKDTPSNHTSSSGKPKDQNRICGSRRYWRNWVMIRLSKALFMETSAGQ